MKIACLSGKGGAGKTFVAVNLAAAANNATYIDCDVEEPNGRLYLNPGQMNARDVTTLLPSFDPNKCTGCKTCVRFCRFHALMYIKEKPMVFSEVCHSCGGCMMVCPNQAITEVPKVIGQVEVGQHRNVKTVTGILNPGEATGVPIIRKALQHAGDLTVIDGPPGSACSVMECVMDADVCLLVAEPTAFGFHNFCMVHQLVSLLEKPCAVVINKLDGDYAPLQQYCEKHHLPVLARIPYDQSLAVYGANAKIAAEEDPAWMTFFAALLEKIGGIV